MENHAVPDVDISRAIRPPGGLIDEPFTRTTLALRRNLLLAGCIGIVVSTLALRLSDVPFLGIKVESGITDVETERADANTVAPNAERTTELLQGIIACVVLYFGVAFFWHARLDQNNWRLGAALGIAK